MRLNNLSPLDTLIEARKLVAKASVDKPHSYLCLALESLDPDFDNESVHLLISWINMQLGNCYTFEAYFDSNEHMYHDRLKWIDGMIQHLRINEDARSNDLNERTFDANILGSMVMSGELPALVYGPTL